MSYLRLRQRAKRLVVDVLCFQLFLGCCEFLPNLALCNRFRGWLVSPFFASCGSGFQLAKGATINMPAGLAIGSNVYIAHDVWINATGGIEVQDNVIISPKVVIASTRHAYRDGGVRLNESSNAPIVIGAGSWIASNCTVTMGVEIGRGCIIGSCSAVTRSTPDYHFCGGVPARPLRDLSACE